MPLDVAYLSELFEAVEDVRCRRMFGRTGIFHDGVMFDLEAGGVLYLKADGSTEAAFLVEVCEPFGYETPIGRRVLSSCWRFPERLLDEPDELGRWAQAAINVAEAATAKPPRLKTARKPLS